MDGSYNATEGAVDHDQLHRVLDDLAVKPRRAAARADHRPMAPVAAPVWGGTSASRGSPGTMPGRQDEVMVVRTLAFMIVRQVLRLVGLGPSADAKDVEICGDANFLIPDPDGFALAIISSSLFMSWQRAIGGRLKADLRFSKTFTYNTFPLPDLTARQYSAVCAAATTIVGARAEFDGWSLAEIYESAAIPEEILAAHNHLDETLGSAFGRADLADDDARQRTLFRYYARLTGQETLLTV